VTATGDETYLRETVMPGSLLRAADHGKQRAFKRAYIRNVLGSFPGVVLFSENLQIITTM